MTARPTDFDVEVLAAYLRGRIPEAEGSLRVERIGGGQSNPSYVLNYPDARFVLRKKPPGVLLPSAHAIDREYRVQSALWQTAVPVPRMRLFCADQSVVGTEFYVMDFVPGRVFADCALPGVSSSERRSMILGAAETLAALHHLDFEALGLGEFGKQGDYYQRQIGRWSRQWELSRTSVNPQLEQLLLWLKGHVPAREATTLIHGDFRIGNVMFAPEGRNVVAVLDWELATLGDPLADVAYCALAWRLGSDEYMGMCDRDLTALGIPDEAEFLAHYREHAPEFEPCTGFHFGFALFRLAVIFEGIAARAQGGNASSDNAQQVGSLAARFARRGLEATGIA